MSFVTKDSQDANDELRPQLSQGNSYNLINMLEFL